jgi:hypothetical protein
VTPEKMRRFVQWAHDNKHVVIVEFFGVGEEDAREVRGRAEVPTDEGFVIHVDADDETVMDNFYWDEVKWLGIAV